MFVEMTRGRSFRGLAQYCLHDVDSDPTRAGADQPRTSDRVDFVETRNLATNNPQVAWRTMAATHYMQDELKERAGVGKGGRKDGKPVGHLLIGWRDDEAEAQQLDRLQMVSAANGALRAIGAEDRQALIVAHTDTQHPHCHVIINLIGEDGRLKKNWKEREKLSKFALEYEIKHHGEPVVKTRERNWEDRNAGETPPPVKKKPRNLYELEKAAEKDEATRDFAERHKAELAAFEDAKTAQKERHTRHRERLHWCLQERTRRTHDETEARIRQAKTETRKAARQTWDALLQEEESERLAFEEREATLKGSVANALKMVDWRALLNGDAEDRRSRLAEAFQVLTSEAVRRERLQKQQQVAKEAMRVDQRRKEQAEAEQAREREVEQIKQHRVDYVRKAASMKERQEQRRTELAEQRSQLAQERDAALKEHRERIAEEKRQRVEQQRQKAREQPRQEAEKEQQVASSSKRTRRERKERRPREPRLAKGELQQQMDFAGSPDRDEEAARRAEGLRRQDEQPHERQDSDGQAKQDDFERRMREKMEQRWEQSRGDDRER